MTRKGGPWEDVVIETARYLGWRVMHVRPIFDGKRKRWVTPTSADGEGYPDLTLVRERVVVAELKTGAAAATPAQMDWLRAFAAAGVEAYVWRDSDWDAVVATLRRRGPTTP